MGTNARIEDEVMPQRNCDAKDEMNLAEFPLCALAHRLNPEVKTLRFEDQIVDKSTGKSITRQLTITGSDAYGLPTEKDDEVLLGLIQITRLHGFKERKVPFTRQELIRMLGWRDDSKSYARIEESLNRWTGVTLYYDNAWWNKARKCWVSPKFHILDNVWLCYRGEPAPDTGLPVSGAPMSAFVWNEVIFRSFTHGNLRSIDFEFFKSLKSAVAKRLYRFLDKRFYHQSRWEMDLRKLACEKVGLSRKYDAAGLKRKLLPGIRELEARGFLCAIERSEQFQKVRRGEWRVTFQRSAAAESQKPSQMEGSANPLTQALIERGVRPDVAESLVAAHSAVHVQEKIEFLDGLLAKGVTSTPRNPPGFLISSIRHQYGRSREHPAKRTPNQKQANLNRGMPGKSETQTAMNRLEDSSRLAQEGAAQRFWKSLSEDDRLRLETEALSKATLVEKAILERRGPLSQFVRKRLILSHAHLFL